MIDLTGQVFGRLTVTGKGARLMCAVRCVCGKRKSVNRYTMLNGTVRSCGCLRRENLGGLAVADPKEIEILLADPSLTLQEIGERVGVCRERVRQIALRFNVLGRDRVVERRRFRIAEKSEAREAEEERLFLAWELYGECESWRASRIINVRLAAIGQKRCCECNLPRPISEMAKSDGGKPGARCRECNARNTREYYQQMR